MSAQALTPKAGDIDICGVCGQPVGFDGRLWRHQGQEPRHPPKPERHGGADPLGEADKE